MKSCRKTFQEEAMIVQRPRAGKELCVFKEQKEGRCVWTEASEGESVLSEGGVVASSHIMLNLVSRALGVYLESHGRVL